MKFWYKTAIFGSIVFVLLFLKKVNTERNAVITPDPSYTTAIEIPQLDSRKTVTIEELLKGLSEEGEPFRQLFFETMVFKGVVRDRFFRWMAIFTGVRGENTPKFLKLTTGETYDGVSVLNVNNKGCVVRYGNIERIFNVK